MTAIALKRLSGLALLSCLGLATLAHAGPEEAARPFEPSPIRNDDAVTSSVSPQLLARLAFLEGGRRVLRAKVQADPAAWTAGRADRAARHRREIAELWGNVVYRIDGQAKLRIHAERMSRLNRMLDLAERSLDQALLLRVRATITRELKRHAKAMQETIAEAGGQ